MTSKNDYNELYLHAREKFYDKINTKYHFDDWLQRHTVLNHSDLEYGGWSVLIIRKTVDETHNGDVEFHDTFWCLGESGDVWQTDEKHFEELLTLPLSVREGHA